MGAAVFLTHACHNNITPHALLSLVAVRTCWYGSAVRPRLPPTRTSTGTPWVARIDATRFAVGTRGFMSFFPNPDDRSEARCFSGSGHCLVVAVGSRGVSSRRRPFRPRAPIQHRALTVHHTAESACRHEHDETRHLAAVARTARPLCRLSSTRGLEIRREC